MVEPASATKPPLQKDYPAQIYSAETSPPPYVAYLERAAAAVHTLKLVVFGLIALSILLAAYGFFLVFELTRDSRQMVVQVSRMADQMVLMRGDVAAMRDTVGRLGTDIGTMTATLASLDRSVGHMASTVGLIQHSTANLDRSFGPAMGMLNSFVPFGMGGNNWNGAPPYALPPGQMPR